MRVGELYAADNSLDVAEGKFDHEVARADRLTFW